MEQPKPQFDVLQAAEDVLHGAQLVEHPVVLPPFVVSDLFTMVEKEHDRRIAEGIYEPLVEDGQDIAHVLEEKLALTLPTTTTGFDAALPLNTPEINLIRQLLAEQESTHDITKETEYEQDVIAFEAAVAESNARSIQDEMRLGMKSDITPRKFNLRARGAMHLSWALSAFIEAEKEYLRPKSSSEFDKDLAIGESTLRAFLKGRQFDVNPTTGRPRLTQVVLNGQQIDYLQNNLQTLKSGMDPMYRKLLDDVVNGLEYSYPMAPIVEVSNGFLKRMMKRITRQNL